jgi:hypothetical protein
MAAATATAEEFVQSIQVPSSTHPGTKYPVRAIPHSDIYVYIGGWGRRACPTRLGNRFILLARTHICTNYHWASETASEWKCVPRPSHIRYLCFSCRSLCLVSSCDCWSVVSFHRFSFDLWRVQASFITFSFSSSELNDTTLSSIEFAVTAIELYWILASSREGQ